MTEERITETTDASGNTHTTHTVVTESEKGGINWIVVLLVLGLLGLHGGDILAGLGVHEDDEVLVEVDLTQEALLGAQQELEKVRRQASPAVQVWS